MNSREPGFSNPTSPLVLVAAGRSFNVDDVLTAAEFRGELAAFRAEWRQTLGRGEFTETAGPVPTEAALESLANEFRFARGLATPEECEDWLSERGLTPEGFQQHIARRFRAVAPEDEDQGRPIRSSPSGMDAPLPAGCRTDLLLSEEFDRMARRLAWRVALAVGNGSVDPAGQLSKDDRGYPEGWEALETPFLARCRELLTSSNRQSCLERYSTRFQRVHLLVVEFDGESAAQEAYHYAKQSGTSLENMARESHLPVQHVRALLEDLPDEWQAGVAGAACATLLPPVTIGNDSQLCFLESKEPPGLEDPEVLMRIDAAILREHFMALEAKYVQWQMRVEVLP